MANHHLRRLAVFVDEPDPGCFYWVHIESKHDASVWDDIASSDESYDTWKEAVDAGNAALMLLASDEKVGPRASGEDENASPVGKSA